MCIILNKYLQNIYTYTFLITMNIIAQQLASKQSTQIMIVSFLKDLKEYFKKAALLSEDKTYSRITKVAQSTQKYIPQFYCLTNMALKLVAQIRARVDDKFEDMKASTNSKNQLKANDEDFEALDKLQVRLSKEKEASTTAFIPLGRQINQQFLRKQVIQVLDELIQQIEDNEIEFFNKASSCIQNMSSILFFDSFLTNKNIINRLASQKSIKIKSIKLREADPKNNQINLADVSSQIRKFQAVFISAQSILKNGYAICQSGSLIVALAAKKYGIPVIVLSRGFGLTQKVIIDQHVLLIQNPMKFFEREQDSFSKVYVGKRFDLIEASLISQIVDELGSVWPSNIETHFSTYYCYN